VRSPTTWNPPVTVAAVAGLMATTLVVPAEATVLNVTVESCAGATATLDPVGVLNSVDKARTASPSISAISTPLPLELT
jgi:hypothetical protein